jgi:hypothetical protein
MKGPRLNRRSVLIWGFISTAGALLPATEAFGRQKLAPKVHDDEDLLLRPSNVCGFDRDEWEGWGVGRGEGHDVG